MVLAVTTEDHHRIGRERDPLQAERQQGKYWIRKLLHQQGIFSLNSGARDLLDRLVTTQTGYGDPIPPHAVAEIARIHARLSVVEEKLAVVDAERQEIRRAGQEAETVTIEGMAATLIKVHGIGVNDATLMSTEVFSRDFQNCRQLGSWAGLTSVPWSSGSIDHDQGITKAGPARERKHLIQMAWRWIRFQPTSKLTLWFKERTKDGHGRNRKRMIVALACKLLVALWQLATIGVVPEGVIFKGLSAANKEFQPFDWTQSRRKPGASRPKWHWVDQQWYRFIDGFGSRSDVATDVGFGLRSWSEGQQSNQLRVWRHNYVVSLYKEIYSQNNHSPWDLARLAKGENHV